MAITEGQQENGRRFDAVDNKMSQMSGRLDHQQKDIDMLKREVALLKARDSSSYSSRGSRISISGEQRVNPNEATSLENQYDLLLTKRRVIAVGGFAQEMTPEMLKEIMRRPTRRQVKEVKAGCKRLRHLTIWGPCASW